MNGPKPHHAYSQATLPYTISYTLVVHSSLSLALLPKQTSSPIIINFWLMSCYGIDLGEL